MAPIRALHVAEKPSVAKKVAEHLGKGVQTTTRSGPSQYNRLFEFETARRPRESHGSRRRGRRADRPIQGAL